MNTQLVIKELKLQTISRRKPLSMFDNKFKNLLLNLQMTKDSKHPQLCFLFYIMAGITLKTDNVEHMLSESQL